MKEKDNNTGTEPLPTLYLVSFDLLFKDKREFNRRKRLLYYYLGKHGLREKFLDNKSTMLLSEEDLTLLKELFKKIRGAVCYVAKVNSLEKWEF